ncbi:MAG: UDP-N-acetylglucosamine pyrophosphorylase [Lachnospiraceae bacterium]|nr:UDP-N-acetylglucosamine pyrophosphorylase [Lachnospiraceae bacterium]
MKELEVSSLLDLDRTIAREIFSEVTYPWEVLPLIHDFVIRLGSILPEDVFFRKGEDIWIARSATIAKTASITGPCIIDEGATLRPGAFVRGNVIVGKKTTVGNSTELKNVILFDQVEVPHYNYVGDSVLGFKAHMGAGAITSNVKNDKTNVVVKAGQEQFETGLRKFGAILGDWVQVGCNCVLNPGSVIGAQTNIYPLNSVRGYVPANSIYKEKDSIVPKE